MGMEMSLRRYDLNLLTVLEALLRHRNVTRAGREVGLSQSATSHALLRLRHMFGDQLLVQSGRRLSLTHRAEGILEPLVTVFELLQQVLDKKHFVPAASTRRFKVGTADYVAMMLLPQLLTRLNEEAPATSVQLTWADNEIFHKLQSNQLDLAIIPQAASEEGELKSEFLFSDELVVIACKDHPEIGDTIDHDCFLRQPLVLFRRDYEGARSNAEMQMLLADLNPHIALLAPEFLLIPFALSGTRSIALLHRRLAERLAQNAQLKMLKPPFEAAPLKMYGYWTKSAHADPAHKWFREAIFASTRVKTTSE